MVVGNVWWHIKATCVGRCVRLMQRQDSFGRQCRRRRRHRNRLPRHPVRRGLPMLYQFAANAPQTYHMLRIVVGGWPAHITHVHTICYALPSLVGPPIT